MTKGRVEASCGGFAAHNDKPAGESLIGWYPTESQAERARASYFREPPVARLFAMTPRTPAQLHTRAPAGVYETNGDNRLVALFEHEADAAWVAEAWNKAHAKP